MSLLTHALAFAAGAAFVVLILYIVMVRLDSNDDRWTGL